MSTKTIRCTICQAEFTEAEIKGASCCPSCGDKGVPCAISDDVTIKINWHELRILCIWAERWAMQADASDPTSDGVVTIDCITQRLLKQHPSKAPLTIRGEVEQVKEIYPDTELLDEDGRPIL